MYLTIFVLNVFDLVLTRIGISMGMTEANPVMAPIVTSWLIVPIKLTGAFLMAYMLWRVREYRVGRAATKFVVGLYVFVVVWNAVNIILG